MHSTKMSGCSNGRGRPVCPPCSGSLSKLLHPAGHSSREAGAPVCSPVNAARRWLRSVVKGSRSLVRPRVVEPANCNVLQAAIRLDFDCFYQVPTGSAPVSSRVWPTGRTCLPSVVLAGLTCRPFNNNGSVALLQALGEKGEVEDPPTVATKCEVSRGLAAGRSVVPVGQIASVADFTG